MLTKMKDIKTYSELITFENFDDRLNYLRLTTKVGNETFGFERIFNQRFYKSKEWRDIRSYVIIRDTGLNETCCDLGVTDHPIYGPVIIHHMNPIRMDDIESNSEYLLNPEYLISTTLLTHNAIHYGTNMSSNVHQLQDRKKNDTCLWHH